MTGVDGGNSILISSNSSMTLDQLQEVMVTDATETVIHQENRYFLFICNYLVNILLDLRMVSWIAWESLLHLFVYLHSASLLDQNRWESNSITTTDNYELSIFSMD